MNDNSKQLENACILVERICRRLGKDCQVIFNNKGVLIPPTDLTNISFGKTLYEALQDAMKNKDKIS